MWVGVSCHLTRACTLGMATVKRLTFRVSLESWNGKGHLVSVFLVGCRHGCDDVRPCLPSGVVADAKRLPHPKAPFCRNALRIDHGSGSGIAPTPVPPSPSGAGAVGGPQGSNPPPPPRLIFKVWSTGCTLPAVQHAGAVEEGLGPDLQQWAYLHPTSHLQHIHKLWSFAETGDHIQPKESAVNRRADLFGKNLTRRQACLSSFCKEHHSKRSNACAHQLCVSLSGQGI